MKALSIRQPWAWLILRPDLTDFVERAKAWSCGQIKDVENRNWRTSFRGWFLIHASAGMTRLEYDLANLYARERGVELPNPGELLRGGIVGRANLVDCFEVGANASDPRYSSRWAEGRYGFLLAEPKPMKFVPMKGQLGFFDVPGSPQSPLRGAACNP